MNGETVVREVSFALLMTSRYERNCRFEHSVHVLDRCAQCALELQVE